jgi:uncharacterized protein (DUF2062 family)
MPRRFLQRYIPHPETLRRQRSLRLVSGLIADPSLWVLSRRSVANAFSVGLFSAMLPMPFQMVAAGFFAIWFNANLPLSVALVWISNPLTMPPMFYFNYKVGALLLGRPVLDFEFHLTWSWLSSRLVEIGIPLYVGSVVVGVIAACASYVVIQFLWRRKVRNDWHSRPNKRID